MADRMLDLLNNDDLCNQLSLNAQQYSERFSCERMFKEIEFLYSELLTSKFPEKTVSNIKYTGENPKMQ
jgi:glycosyltransferase involved in cell wall biosynthesis